MDMQFIFSGVIYLLILILSFFIARISFNILQLNNMVEKRCVSLKREIYEEAQKHQFYANQILLIEDLNESLFNRVFQITKDFILMQKLIFGKHFN
ncbi:hypothetical protein APS56_13505 [Pseudalgibacter alginicilyticus]|uniref:Uncharacterized protein n=1 Tax=Pseudalgibacter alginicilyticus TaxID=1736674 RepID=A0A0P0DDG2_9FLAO|nr:hypothetical protein APS56_13505 [Pseudalgibacter alginicilyticus]